jgi:hypothetical protein
MDVIRFPHHPLLGGHQVRDPRNLSHTIERDETKPKIAPIDHPLGIDILDQSNLLAQGIHTSKLVKGAADVDELGSCTCNAGTYSLSTSPTIRERVKAAGKTLDESFAITMYGEVTRADEVPGNWPPDDTGSSGYGVCKVFKRHGWIGSYQWATTAEGLAALLQRGSVMIGMPWFNSFFEPDRDGFIDGGSPDDWESSGLAGGHELCVTRLETWDARDPGKSVIVLPNSWNRSWGDNGYGRMRLSTYTALRKQIDVKQIRV